MLRVDSQDCQSHNFRSVSMLALEAVVEVVRPLLTSSSCFRLLPWQQRLVCLHRRSIVLVLSSSQVSYSSFDLDVNLLVVRISRSSKSYSLSSSRSSSSEYSTMYHIIMSTVISASRHRSPRLQSRVSGIQNKMVERYMWCPYSCMNRLS